MGTGSLVSSRVVREQDEQKVDAEEKSRVAAKRFHVVALPVLALSWHLL